MSEVLLKIENLKKYFPLKGGFGKKKFVHAVDDVSLEVYAGETLGIVGESGSGKTTLANMILGLLKPTSGTITLDGVDVTSRKGRKEMYKLAGAVFQDPASSLNPRFTVYRTLERPLLLHGMSKADAKTAIENVIAQVKLTPDVLQRFPGELSGGQQQRVSIARAILLKGKLLMLDEPTSALDVSVQAQTLNELLDLQEQYGLTYIFITHNISVVRYVSDRICVMYGGRIMEIGSSEEVYNSFRHPYTAGLFASVPPMHPKYRNREKHLLTGDVPSLIGLENCCPFAACCKYCTEECKYKAPELAEIQPGHFVACHNVNEIELH